ncbi:MAG: hypothetical protein HRU38_15090 [Saccharospirillaceae bacterium]|nr:hypothetical protein [Pseudomonadales bacterium]NRB79967.1 hypothetical protein [Saccharospirillaceae bacterium]
MKVIFIVVMFVFLVYGCTSLPTKKNLFKSDPLRSAIVIGELEINSSNNGLIDYTTVSFEILDKNNLPGKRFDYLHTSPVERNGVFSFSLPEGTWEINKIKYHSSEAYGDSNGYKTLYFNYNMTVKVKAGEIVNLGKLILSGYRIRSIDNSNKMKILLKTLNVDDIYLLNPIINAFEG